MRTILILAGLMLSLVAESQEIYRWVDKDGVVHYADQPGAADAERVEIADSNTYGDVPPADESSQAAGETPEPATYDSLVIVQPTPDQVFFGADATVTVAAELGGTLQSDHTMVFFLNGERVPATGGQSAQLSNLQRGSYFVRAAVLDQNGASILTSPQVTFHVREPSINSPQSPQNRPPPPPRPRPLPAG